MAGQEGSRQEMLLFAVAVAAAGSVFAAAVDYHAAVAKDAMAKAVVISGLETALSHGSRENGKTTGAASAGGSALAQAGNPPPTSAAPLDSVPGENLSKKLEHSNGVIHPKEVDPAIEKPAPKVGDPNVAPPPGTRGGAPAPQPK